MNEDQPVRLFVAIDLTPSLREQLVQRLQSVQQRLPAARWVRPENLHVTLHFLGQTKPSDLRSLGQALAEACKVHAPFELQLGKVDAFRSRGRDSILHLTAGPADHLTRLHAAVRQASPEHTRDDRRYRPHLTLARYRKLWPDTALEELRAAMGTSSSAAIERCCLFESQLTPDGPRYRRLDYFPLEGGS